MNANPDAFAHANPKNASRFARRVGPYAQDRDGGWFVFNSQRGWLTVDPRTSRGLRSYQRETLRRRYGQSSEGGAS